MNYVGSIRYDQYGRKRKTIALSASKVRSSSQVRTPGFQLGNTGSNPVRTTKHYPSAPLTPCRVKSEDNSWKVKESKNFTVAPAYNKGAYQVIPRKDVEHIGK
jgi:hypothetical protein